MDGFLGGNFLKLRRMLQKTIALHNKKFLIKFSGVQLYFKINYL